MAMVSTSVAGLLDQSILPQFGGIDANDLLEDVRSGTLGLCNRTYLVFVPQVQRVCFLHTRRTTGAVPSGRSVI